MKKSILSIVGISALILGMSLNFQYTWNDYELVHNPSLNLYVWGQSTSGGGLCTGRGGNEAPTKVLLKQRCIKSMSGNLHGSITISGNIATCTITGGVDAGIGGDVTFGDECVCKDPDQSFQGTKGCNLYWETACN